MPGIAHSLVAAALFVSACVSAFRAWRLSRWTKIEAHVLRVELVGPLGLVGARFARQFELQRRGQVAMGPEPEIVYYAELVYVVDGVPHIAELTFDGPPDDKFPLRFDPRRPSDYTAEDPSWARAIALAATALIWTLHFLIRS